jgi:TRAP-type C4-dicarboxylate transport system substrate-binding protein
MRKALSLALGLTLATTLAPAAQGADYRWLNSFDRNHDGVPNFVEPYIKAVESASGGRMKFLVSGPETVPAFEQLQPVASGAFQFLFTHGAYHFGTTPLLASVEALGGTREQRKTSGALEYIDKQYQKLGLKLVALPMTAEGGYQMLLRKPPTANGDLQGFKVRGWPTVQPVLRMLGASMIVLPPAEIYTALDKGVVDGFAYPSFGVLRSKLYEPTKYLLRPSFGFIANPVLANLNTWNRLPEVDRKLLLSEAAKAEERWENATSRIYAEEEKALVSAGMQIVQLGQKQRAALQHTYSEGIWELGSQKSKAQVDELRAIARSKGIDGTTTALK